MKNTTLTTHQLTCGYAANNPLFTPLDMTLKAGTITAILGGNGQGKTTLLRTLLGLQTPLSGKVIHHASINFVPQRFNAHFAYTVEDMVLMGRAKRIGLFALPRQQDYHAVQRILSELNIDHLREALFDQLSGGQQQLVLIARALVTDCQILMLDEPTTALDLSFQSQVLTLLRQLASERQISVIFSSHNPAHAEFIADDVLLLTPNKNGLLGPRAEMLTPEHLHTLYGVPIHRYHTEFEGQPYSTLAPVLTER